MLVSIQQQSYLCPGGDPEKVKKSERDRFRDDKIVDDIIEIDNKWRKSKLHITPKYGILIMLNYSEI